MPRETTERYGRVRIRDPKDFDPRSFRAIDPGRSGKTKLIVACPKGFYKAGRCTVGMQTQAILKERNPNGKTRGLRAPTMPLELRVSNLLSGKGTRKTRRRGERMGGAGIIAAILIPGVPPL